MADEILDTKDLSGMRVYSAKGAGRTGGGHSLGKVRHAVFHPRKRRVLGLLVKRPDALLMFHRHDLFVPLGTFDIRDGGIYPNENAQSEGKDLFKRLGISWDSCVLWAGLPVMAEDGTVLGTVRSARFDARTGDVESIEVEQGLAAKALLGRLTVPAEMVRGFRRGVGVELAASDDVQDVEGEPGTELADPDVDASRGALVVSDEAKALVAEGGMAEKAGRASAVAADTVERKVKPAASQAAEKTGEAVNAGAFALGRQLGRTKGMFSEFKQEFDKARRDD